MDEAWDPVFVAWWPRWFRLTLSQWKHAVDWYVGAYELTARDHEGNLLDPPYGPFTEEMVRFADRLVEVDYDFEDLAELVHTEQEAWWMKHGIRPL